MQRWLCRSGRGNAFLSAVSRELLFASLLFSFSLHYLFPSLVTFFVSFHSTLFPSFSFLLSPPSQDGSTSSLPHTACNACPPGQCCPADRNQPCLGCVDCTPGHFQSSPGRKTCSPCPYGSYAEHPGTVECTSCGSGRYLEQEGSANSKDCKLCPVNYYCPDDRTRAPIECPVEGYCPEGSSAPLYCNELFQPDPANLVSGFSSWSPSSFAFWFSLSLLSLLSLLLFLSFFLFSLSFLSLTLLSLSHRPACPASRSTSSSGSP